MTIPVITHSNEGIRFNFDGVVELHANAVYLAEMYARQKCLASIRAKAVADACEPLRRLANHLAALSGKESGLSDDNHVRICEQGCDEIEAVIAAVGELVKAVG